MGERRRLEKARELLGVAEEAGSFAEGAEHWRRRVLLLEVAGGEAGRLKEGRVRVDHVGVNVGECPEGVVEV